MKCVHLKYYVNTVSTNWNFLFFMLLAHVPVIENLKRRSLDNSVHKIFSDRLSIFHINLHTMLSRKNAPTFTCQYFFQNRWTDEKIFYGKMSNISVDFEKILANECGPVISGQHGTSLNKNWGTLFPDSSKKEELCHINRCKATS